MSFLPSVDCRKFQLKKAIQSGKILACTKKSEICATSTLNHICTGGEGKFAPPLSYFNITPKRNQAFALMHPDFKSNLITHIFRKFGVSRTTGSDVIFAFVSGI